MPQTLLIHTRTSVYQKIYARTHVLLENWKQQLLLIPLYFHSKMNMHINSFQYTKGVRNIIS